MLYIEGLSVRHVTRLRTEGMMSTKPQRVAVNTLKGDWPQQSGHRAIKSWMALSTSRDLHVGMIASQNDDMAIGARRAFEELGDMKARDSWLSLPITGCDGVPKSGQSWVREGRLGGQCTHNWHRASRTHPDVAYFLPRAERPGESERSGAGIFVDARISYSPPPVPQSRSPIAGKSRLEQ